MHPLRSFLFAPGNHPRKVEKVFEVGADAVILDLEDAVAVAEKAATRATVTAALGRRRRALGYVRINGLDTDFAWGDFAAVIGPGLDGIVLPKVETADHVRTADWIMAQLEREAGLAAGSVDLLPIVETGLGVHNIEAIAAAGTRVRRVSFGAGDFTRDMNLVWDRRRGRARLCPGAASCSPRARPASSRRSIPCSSTSRTAPTWSARRAAPTSSASRESCASIPTRSARSTRCSRPTRPRSSAPRRSSPAFRAAESGGLRLDPGRRLLRRLPHRREGAARARPHRAHPRRGIAWPSPAAAA